MQGTGKPHDALFCGGSEFREGEGKSSLSVAVMNVADDAVCMVKDAAPTSLSRRLALEEWTTLITVALLYGIALVLAWFLSLVVRVHGDQFPFGALTPLQLTAFTLCFFAIALQVSNMIFAWMRGSRETALVIRAASEASVYLLLFFVCDRTSLLLRRPRVFNADFFSFIALAFVCAAVATARPIRQPAHGDADHGRGSVLPSSVTAPEPQTSAVLFAREHIREWRGWAQLLYVLYGYFHNVHIYGMVRLCVSGVAFFTAFTSYARYDAEVPLQQSAVTLLRSLWRLNALVVATCALLRNQYMLYHICAVQTAVTVAVYLLVNVGPSPRSGPRVLAVKLGVAAVVVCALYDTPYSPAVFRLFWRPLQWLVRYDNPIVGVEPLHEWQFRSRLDHWIWLVGVAVASRATFLSGLLRRLDSHRPVSVVMKVAAAAAAVCVIATYAYLFRATSTVDYNLYLPYLSWLPILGFVTVRCVFRWMRCLYMPLCTCLGAFALEAYVAHNHVFMTTTGPNSGPLYTLRLLPGDHQMCDFGIFLVLLLWVSSRLEAATLRLQRFVLPDGASLVLVAENVAALVFAVALTYLLHSIWCAVNAPSATR